MAINENKFLKKALTAPSAGCEDVSEGVIYWRKQLLKITQQNLINFIGLDYTLPQYILLNQLIVKGFSVVVEKDGKLYSPLESYVYLDTKNDVYFVPSFGGYSNPVLGSESRLKDMKDCAIIWASDTDKMNYTNITPVAWTSFQSGTIYKTICRYASLLANLDSSMASAITFARAIALCQADDDNTAQGFKTAIDRIREGDPSVTVKNDKLKFDNLKSLNINPDFNSLPNFQALRDYLISCFLREIGISALVSQEKKERLITDELEADDPICSHNIDIFYSSIKEGVAKINQLYNRDIKVVKNKVLKV